jgi:hypothetical protein
MVQWVSGVGFLMGNLKFVLKTAFAQRGRINICHWVFHNDPNIVWKKNENNNNNNSNNTKKKKKVQKFLKWKMQIDALRQDKIAYFYD